MKLKMRFDVADAHCDTISKLFLEVKGTLRKNDCHVDLNKLASNSIQVFAVFAVEDLADDPLRKALDIISFYHQQMVDNSDLIVHCDNDLDVRSALDSGRRAALLSIEGGEVLGVQISLLRVLRKLGVKIITLTWNYDNEISTCAASKKSGGLSDFGNKVIDQMNELGIIIDVSHLSSDGFWDVLERSNAPIMASHSNAFGVCPHFRNLSDQQIQAIIKCRGFIGINFYPAFLTTDSDGTVADILKHIEYILGLGGQDVLGFGSDFDGVSKTPVGINDASGFALIIEQMLKLNYSEQLVKKIASANFLSLLSSVG